jgi:hypothetical protein
LEIGKASTAITLDEAAVCDGNEVTIVARVTSSFAQSEVNATGGTVILRDNSNNILKSIMRSEDGVFTTTLSLTLPSSGIYNVSVEFVPNTSNLTGSSSTAPVGVKITVEPKWESSLTNVGKGSARPIVGRPTGTQKGDLLVIGLIIEKGTGSNIIPPAGWTSIMRTNRATNGGIETFYKVAGDNEPASYVFTLTNNSNWAIGISRITVAEATDPIMAVQGNNGGMNTNTVAPSIMTDGCNTMVKVFIGSDQNATFSTPTGTIKRYDQPNMKDGKPSNMLAT